MPASPDVRVPSLVTITPFSLESVGPALQTLGAYNLVGGTSNGQWSAADRAIYIPFVVTAPLLITKMSWINGSAVAGSVDLGIYSEDGTRIVSTGPTTQAGISTVQSVDTTDTLLAADVYFLGFTMSTAGATALIATRTVPTPDHCAFLGIYTQDSLASSTLPATATFARCANGTIPMISITGRNLI